MSVVRVFEDAVIQTPKVKFQTPDAWAKDAVENLGPELAATIAKKESRDMIGTKNDVPNPNKAWYNHAYKWIVKRYPKTKGV